MGLITVARARVGVITLCLLLHVVTGHRNSVINLHEGGGTELYEGSVSVNAKWQCEPQSPEVGHFAGRIDVARVINPTGPNALRFLLYEKGSAAFEYLWPMLSSRTDAPLFFRFLSVVKIQADGRSGRASGIGNACC